MTTTYTANVALPLQGTGDNPNTWGSLLNSQTFNVLDDLLGAILSKSVAGSGTTILGATDPGTNESKKRAYNFTGILTGNSTVLWPQSLPRFFSATNSTTGSFTLTLGANNGSGAVAGTTVTIAQGQTLSLASDGTNVILATAPLRGSIFGLGLSNDSGTPNTKLDVATGQAVDSTNTVLMSLGTASIIDMTANGAGGLDTGSIAASKYYAALLIAGTAGVAVMATVETAGSAISPTMPTGYTYYRYIGTWPTDGSSHLLAVTQEGQYFLRKVPVNDYTSSAPPTSPTLVTLSVPLGLNVVPLENVLAANMGASQAYSMLSGITGRTASYSTFGPSLYPDFNLVAAAGAPTTGANITGVVTDTSGRAYHACGSAGATISLYNNGWIDPHVAAVF